MADITKRNRQKVELASIGYSLRYIDDWQPKTTLYRHKPSYNEEGIVVADVGTTTPNVPGNPDYVLSKARIGLFPWPPSETCECRWCVSSDPARSIGGETVVSVKKETEAVVAVDDPTVITV